VIIERSSGTSFNLFKFKYEVIISIIANKKLFISSNVDFIYLSHNFIISLTHATLEAPVKSFESCYSLIFGSREAYY